MTSSHEWLSDTFAHESRKQALHEESSPGQSKNHHYVPRFYLKRWAVARDGKKKIFFVKMTMVDTGATYVQPLEELAAKSNFNRYAADDIDQSRFPALWVEKHMSRIETPCAHRLDQICTATPGPVTDQALIDDLAVFVVLQYVRGTRYRNYALALDDSIATTDPRQLRATVGALLPTLLHKFGTEYDPTRHEQQLDMVLSKSTASGSADSRVKALDLALSDSRILYSATRDRDWATYSTSQPLVTCDEPVTMIAGPPHDRSRWLGPEKSPVMIFPLDPHHLLVMLNSPLVHTGPFHLNETETRQINLEIVAAAERSAFERPEDDIARQFDLPPRRPRTHTSDADLFESSRQPERWPDGGGPEWPVSRWYTPN
ncbi:DUF4238 domain-containing protein [Nocardia sp. NPDC051321]|uniref:DUF4238 domain-containing protein n=1 Tax=Nocardia sp. NPDC051321 TaxID=3364323 RepID=UPI003788E38B